MTIDIKRCAELLSGADDVLILTHERPDGDTLGSAFALCRALLSLGKRVRVECADEIPKKYSYLTLGIEKSDFEPKFVVAVDVATVSLLGSLGEKYGENVDLCIDHHSTNTQYAQNLLLIESAACCENIYMVLCEMGIEIMPQIADCLYTGITTDTGCFRYDSAKSQTYRIASELIDAGARNGWINRVMFETKTKTYARLERLALDSMRFYCGDRVAVITITQQMYEAAGSSEQETEAIAPLTRQIEGVEIGITIRENKNKTCKASIRTFERVNAAELAKMFGGGGHPQAAACRFETDVDSAREMLVEKCGVILE